LSDRLEPNESHGQKGVKLANRLGCLFLLTLRIFVQPDEAADFNGYLGYVRSELDRPVRGFGKLYEPASRLAFRTVRYFVESPADTVILIAWCVSGLALFSLYRLIGERADNPMSVALVWAIAGPLIVINTLRATPAYLLVLSVYLSKDPKSRRSLLRLLIACCFHITALVPLFVWLASNKTGRIIRRFQLQIVAGVSFSLLCGIGFGARLGDFGGADVAKHLKTNTYLSPQHAIYCVFIIGLILSITRRPLPSFDATTLSLFAMTQCLFILSPAATFRISLYWVPFTLLSFRSPLTDPKNRPFSLLAALVFLYAGFQTAGNSDRVFDIYSRAIPKTPGDPVTNSKE
jgi:EpsG family